MQILCGDHLEAWGWPEQGQRHNVATRGMRESSHLPQHRERETGYLLWGGAGGRKDRFKKEFIRALVAWTLEDGKSKFSDTATVLKA
jgi:hypothetical protein